jgi:hypothetical protein
MEFREYAAYNFYWNSVMNLRVAQNVYISLPVGRSRSITNVAYLKITQKILARE